MKAPNQQDAEIVEATRNEILGFYNLFMRGETDAFDFLLSTREKITESCTKLVALHYPDKLEWLEDLRKNGREKK